MVLVLVGIIGDCSDAGMDECLDVRDVSAFMVGAGASHSDYG